MHKIREAFSAVVGKRTQIIMVLYAIVEALGVVGVLEPTQVESLHSVLLPLAGATLAAKINNIGGIAKYITKA